MWPVDTKYGFCATREAKFIYNVALEDILSLRPRFRASVLNQGFVEKVKGVRKDHKSIVPI